MLDPNFDQLWMALISHKVLVSRQNAVRNPFYRFRFRTLVIFSFDFQGNTKSMTNNCQIMIQIKKQL